MCVNLACHGSCDALDGYNMQIGDLPAVLGPFQGKMCCAAAVWYVLFLAVIHTNTTADIIACAILDLQECFLVTCRNGRLVVIDT